MSGGRNNGKGPRTGLTLNISMSNTDASRRRAADDEEVSRNNSSSSPSSCTSSEASNSPEVTSMVLAACPRCLMYVMLAEGDPKCPQCKSTVVLDILGNKGNSRNR